MHALKCTYVFYPHHHSQISDTFNSDEKNEKSKLLIGKKIEEYLARAETLKGHIQAGEKKPKKAVGVDGSMNGTNSGDQK